MKAQFKNIRVNDYVLFRDRKGQLKSELRQVRRIAYIDDKGRLYLRVPNRANNTYWQEGFDPEAGTSKRHTGVIERRATQAEIDEHLKQEAKREQVRQAEEKRRNDLSKLICVTS